MPRRRCRRHRVLLTVSTTADPTTCRLPASDLGHLLHQHPDRAQAFAAAAGTAHVLHPIAGHEERTAALPANLARLGGRGLGLGLERSLVVRESALGVEALERRARGEPPWRVHECVLAVLVPGVGAGRSAAAAV